MRNLIVILLLVSGCAAASSQSGQSGFRFGGTFIGAAITEDGIIVASDSRSTFLDTEDRRMGYIDGMPKIFVGQASAVAVSGLTSIDKELFSSFIRRSDFLFTRTPEEILFGVLVWLPFRNSENVALLSAGFPQGQPTICAKPPMLPQDCTRYGYYTSKPASAFRQWFGSLGRLPKPADAAAALKRAIQDSAAGDSSVGGPISILHLRKNAAPLWLENRPSDNGWATICDIVRAYRQGRAEVGFATSKADLDRYLNGACPR